MKHTLKMIALGVAVVGLSACADGLGNFQDAPPYSIERTAQHEGHVMVTPEPMVMPSCPEVATPAPCDCSAWKDRALKAEAEAAANLEASQRVQRAHSESLRK